MEMNFQTLLIIIGTCAVTQFEKGAPLWLLGRRKLGAKVERWLGFIPAAVLTALLVPELLLRRTPEGAQTLFLSADNVFLIASIPALAVAYWRRSFFGAVITGMAAVALLRYLL